MSNPVPRLLDHWQQVRAELRALAEAEHPPIFDRHGREWTWQDGDVYVHDGLLAWPLASVRSPEAGLPTPDLAERNPNYAGLCATCRHDRTEN